MYNLYVSDVDGDVTISKTELPSFDGDNFEWDGTLESLDSAPYLICFSEFFGTCKETKRLAEKANAHFHM